MASAVIHLAIAKKYMENHPNINYKEFIKGTLYPDSEANNIELHYPKSFIMDKYAIGVYNKVDLYAFLKDHKELDDFEIGWFLHLVTDYLFFSECFSREYLENTLIEDFCEKLYHAYDCLDTYLFTKYDIKKSDFEAYPSEYYPGVPYEECLLSKELIDSFIKRVSSIELDEYIKKIESFKGNIKP